MAITAKKLWVKSSAATPVGYYLFTTAITTPRVCVRAGGATLYCPLESGTAVTNVRVAGGTYKLVNYRPYFHFEIYLSQDTSTAYRYGYTYQLRNIKFTNNKVTLAKAISIQARINGEETAGNTAGAWTTIATLPANANSMSNPASVRVLGSSTSRDRASVRIVIGSGVINVDSNVARYSWTGEEVEIGSSFF